VDAATEMQECAMGLEWVDEVNRRMESQTLFPISTKDVGP